MMSGIPTLYKQVQFRSRLEARWAAFFDLCGRGWEYEPLDLHAYIPDFVLKFHRPIIVEVKPILDLRRGDPQTAAAKEKIEQSGWAGEALILGAYPDLEAAPYVEVGSVALGHLNERRDGRKEIDWDNAWGHAILERCKNCGRVSFIHDEMTWSCRVTGCYAGDHFLQFLDAASVRDLWARAGNEVQWRRLTPPDAETARVLAHANLRRPFGQPPLSVEDLMKKL